MVLIQRKLLKNVLIHYIFANTVGIEYVWAWLIPFFLAVNLHQFRPDLTSICKEGGETVILGCKLSSFTCNILQLNPVKKTEVS